MYDGQPAGSVPIASNCPASHPNLEVASNRCYDNPDYLGEEDPEIPIDVQPEKNSGCGKAMVGNPCNAATGNKFQQEKDYIGAGVMPLRFERYYNSLGGASTSLGAKWRGTYHRSLDIAANVIFARRQNGQRLRFIGNNNIWQSDRDVFIRLVNTNGLWELTTELDEVERYNANGRLMSITTREGWVQTLSYNTAGQLSLVADPAGRVLSFIYDSSGRLTELTDPAGELTRFEYSAAGMLASVVYPDATPNNLIDNPRRQYLYEDAVNPQALTGLINENGVRFATWAYDSSGRVVSSEHAGGVERVTLTQNVDGATTVVNGLSESATYEFDQRNAVSHPVFTTRQACATCGSESEALVYNENGQSTFRAAAANRFGKKTYNARGLVETQTEASPAEGLRTTTTVWHSNWRLPLSITESARTTYFEYDNARRLIRYTVTENIASTTREWNITYSNGMPVVIDGPRNDVSDVSTRTYDTQFNLISATNAAGHVTTVTGVDPHGRITGWTDSNGVIHQMVYDRRGRTVSVTDGSRTTQYEFDAAGNLTQLTLPDDTYVDYVYDGANRLTSVTHPSGDKVEYQYDAMSNKIGEVAKDATGNVQRSFSWLYHMDRMIAFARGGAASTTIGYSFANRLTDITTTDPRGVVTLRKYNASNDIVTQYADIGGVAANASFEYDVMSNLINVMDPLGESTVYGYNGLGSRKTETSPATGATTWTYDNAGNEKTRRDAQLNTVTTSYDVLNRVTAWDFPGTTDDAAFIYDVGSGCANSTGRLCRVEEGPLQTTYSYNQAGQITQFGRNVSGVNFSTTTTYNPAGRMTTLGYPSGRNMAYEYDVNGRLRTLRTTINGVITDIIANRSYNADGQLISQTLGNGITESRSYNNAGVPVSVAYGALESLSYSYDDAGNIVQRTDGGGTRGFGYDGLNRITSETAGAAVTSYVYDANGNRTQRASAGVTLDYAYVGNKLQTITNSVNYESESISTDVLGRRSDDQNGVRTYNYNARGHLASVSIDSSLIAEYQYDYRGLRSRKTIHNPDNSVTVVLYHYDVEGHLIAETDAQGNTLHEVLWVDDQPVAQINGSNIVYLHTDHLDTPRLASNSAGVVVWRWRSDAYGVGAVDDDVDGDLVKTEVNLRFPGQYFDAETGLHYNWNRYYEPTTGRYITSDPIGLAGGLNTYTYVENNPLGFADPSGLLRLQSDFIRKYPKTAARINSMDRRITQKKFDAWKKWGQAGKKAVLRALTPGRGPLINPDCTQGAGEGSFAPDIGSTVLNIGETTFENFEKGLPGAREEMDRTIEHELTHYFDDQDGVDTVGEEGWSYEWDAYGTAPVKP